ncbi:MAG: energy transducer TonB [Planctomycetes bacterium]|nr:energy transducer TonB [Planctomycetota bacterium]
MRPRTFLISTMLHVGAVVGIGVCCGAIAGPGRAPCPTVAFLLDEPVDIVVVETVDEPVEPEQNEPEPPMPSEPFVLPAEFRPEERFEDVAEIQPEQRLRQIRTRVRAAVEPAPEVVEVAAEPVVAPPVAFVEAKARDDQNVPPRYPRESVRLGETGEVVVLLEIDARGNVLSAELHRGCGFPRLHRAVLDAARGWKFEPARELGEPVASRKLHTTVFELR